ncbi:MAG: hypothetical protein SF052_21690 [Bacteroidia bacterium]|nr:hypothetical protein [Bacteroidia bacterium]
MKFRKIILFLLFLLTTQLQAQQILIDRGLRAGGLWCFPLLTDSLTWLYLPSEGKLATDAEGNPQFSLLRYVINKPSATNTGAVITDADGGAVLHFLFLYETPEDQVENAQKALQEKLGNQDVKLRGPVIFDKGRYTLISSILKPAPGQKEVEVLSTGEAPVLEGSKIALTFDLTPQKSKLLMESLKMKTSDISVVFDLSFSGLTDSYNAKLEIDWSEVRKSESFKAGGSIYFVSADVGLAFDRMRRDNAIKLTTIGENANLDGLLNTVYDKLLKLLFDPVQPERVPAAQQGGLADAIGAMVGGSLNSRNTTGFGLNVGYQLKDMKTEGTSVLTFNGRSTVDRHHFITFNAGDLYNQYGQDERYFRDVPLWDPAFQQREIFVGVDGDMEKEFTSMLNSVSVNLRKIHQGGQETMKSVLIQRSTFLNFNGKLSMVYGSVKDTNRIQWLDYEYQTQWQFQGGGSYVTPWIEDNASMINLYTPFRRHKIEIDGDLAGLEEQGIRAIILEVSYPFFDQVKKVRQTIRPGDNLTTKSMEITLPNEQEKVDYVLTWIKKDGSKAEYKGQDQYGLIFIDELPQN